MKASGSPALRTLVLVMVTIAVIGVLIARSYYGNRNRSVDPRIVQARELYSGYDQVARSGDFHRIFSLLDSIEYVYMATAHYQSSFELGVVENNRAAALLTIALYGDSIPGDLNPLSGLEFDSVVALAQWHVMNAIRIYESWNRKYEGHSTDNITALIASGFVDGLEDFSPEKTDKYIRNRTREIEKALNENDRRLSVCYTNLGVVYRLQEAFVDAVKQYEKALALWDRNLDAENNLNKLINQPVKKRTILQKMFPPEK